MAGLVAVVEGTLGVHEDAHVVVGPPKRGWEPLIVLGGERGVLAMASERDRQFNRCGPALPSTREDWGVYKKAPHDPVVRGRGRRRFAHRLPTGNNEQGRKAMMSWNHSRGVIAWDLRGNGIHRKLTKGRNC